MNIFHKIFWFLTKEIEPEIKPIPNELLLFLEYTEYGSYGSNKRFAKKNFENLLMRFKETASSNGDYVYIEGKFNGIIYPFYDLDNEENREVFEKTHEFEDYVLFQSSPGHYWGIIGQTPYTNTSFFYDTDWLSCNDPKYVSCSKGFDNIRIRGLYENMFRKPKIVKENLKEGWSENFSTYIESLVKYYDNESLELSVLKYKTPELILLFNRKRKLEQIEEKKNGVLQ